MKEIVKKSNIINNFIGISLLFQPLLNAYWISGIPGSLSDLSIAIIVDIWLLFIVRQKGLCVTKNMLFFVPFLGYVLVSSIITIALVDESVFTEYLRIGIRYFLLATLILPDIKINDWVKRWFSRFSFLLTIYCVMQYVAINFLRIYLPSYIPFLNFREDLKSESNFLSYPWYYRPHSLFQEPAHFCEFILVYLALLLFDRKSNVKNYVLRIFVSAVIFLTGSTTGFVGVIVLWGLFVKANMKQKIPKSEIVPFIIVIPVVVLTVMMVLDSNSFNILLRRTFSSGAAVNSRFENISEIFKLRWNVVHAIFGFGYRYDYFADKIGWLPSYFMILLYFGVLGLVLILFSLIGIYARLSKNQLSKSLFILFLILNIATEMFFDMHLIMYLFFILCFEEKKVYVELSKSEHCSASI